MPLWYSLTTDPAQVGGVTVDAWYWALLAFAVGIVTLPISVALLRATAAGTGALSRLLLGADTEELSERVEVLTETRAGAVDAAAAELERIERDLHDGAQARLVALAMDLGMAEERFERDPEGARELVEKARDEAKQALAELRGFVRGLHPAVLDERGLDAALSGIVARSPVPTSLHVLLAQRPPRTLEAVAYFVVSEALTNVARHSGATRAAVRVTSEAHRLVVEVSDDGRGGATTGAGSGLTGLTNRVASVDGTLTVTSPVGGPTVLRAEMPCVS
jgi:signal transduction histidine kinase